MKVNQAALATAATKTVAGAKTAGAKVYAEAQTPMGKKVLKGALIALGIYVAYRIVKGFMEDSPNREEQQATTTELDALNNNPKTKQKISPSQAMSYANALVVAMDGYGTDEVAIKSTFYKLYNNADYLALSKAFGTRTISSGNWNPEPNFKGTMAAALRSELDWSLVKELNDILKKKGITYRV